MLVFIFFFLVLTSVITYIKNQQSQEKIAVEKVRIDTLDSFSDALKVGADKVAYIAGYNAIKNAADYVATNINKKYINNSRCGWNSCIFELIYNASIENNSTYKHFNSTLINFTSANRMGNGTLKYWVSRLNATAVRANIRLNISISDASVYQIDPWNIRISYLIYANMDDMTKEAITIYRNAIDAYYSYTD